MIGYGVLEVIITALLIVGATKVKYSTLIYLVFKNKDNIKYNTDFTFLFM